MGSTVIGRERSRDCSLIGGEGLLSSDPPHQSESSHVTALDQSQRFP